jgi:geranylgeranyl diphosphate synthase type II
MKSYSDFYHLIESEIAQLSIEGNPKELYDPIKYMLSLGGKRLRPVLVLMGYHLFKKDIAQAINAAMAVEVFHNFTLVHDDMMDKADIRRGKPTVHKKWNETIGILSGDLMMIKATQLLCKTHSKNLLPMLQVFSATAVEVCEGQQLDMNFEEQQDVTEAEYLHMITLKTAVLLGASLQLGAMAANASEADGEHLYAFGKNIGVAFQIHDDVLDSFGQADKVGKKIGGDILAGKKTILLIKALELSGEHERKKLTTLLADRNLDDNKKIQQVLARYDELNVRLYAEEMKQQYLNKAFEELDRIEATTQEEKELLKTTAKELMQRMS